MALTQLRTRDGIAIITFDRPEKLNALCTQMLQELHKHLRQIESDNAVQVVVLTGNGRAFVAGADIEEYSKQGVDQFIHYQRYSRELFSYIHHFPKPIIAGVNGYALGGGFEIVLCSDIVVASEFAKFGLPEVLLGLVPGGGGIQKLRRIVGRHIAADMLFTGRHIGAHDAFRLGLVSQVTSAETLLSACMEKAESITQVGTLAVRELKRLLHEGSMATFETALSLEQGVLFRLFETNEGQEGIRAFLEKRKPSFAQPFPPESE